MRSAIALATLLAGCQLVFPLQEPSTDAPPVHGTITTKTATQSAGGGVSVIDGNGDAATVVATVAGEDVAVDVIGGELTFERPEAAYQLAVTFGGEILEIQDDSAELNLLFPFAGRDGVAPVNQATVLQLPTPAGTVTGLSTTGQWTSSFAPAAATTFDWKDVKPNGGKPVGLLSGADGDRLFYLRYTTGAFAPGVAGISDYFVRDDLAMVDGMPVDLTGETVIHQATPTRCVQLRAQQEANVIRFMDVLNDVPFPVSYDGAVRDWQIFTVPSLETGITGAIGVASSSPPELDFDEPAPFFDPIGGQALAFVHVSNQRQIKFSDPLAPAHLPASLVYFDVVPPGDDCATNAMTFDDTIALARDIALDGTALVTEHQAITIERPGNAVLTWTPDNGRFDTFDVTLYEVIDAGSETAVAIRRHFRTRTPRLIVSDDLLSPGHQYIFQVASVVRFPNARDGDYATFTFPISSGTVYSSVFEAM